VLGETRDKSALLRPPLGGRKWKNLPYNRAVRKLSFLFALICGVSVAGAQSSFTLKANDRVLFYGDSITDFSQYPNFVETFVLTRYPKLPVRFFNMGVGGDTVNGGWMGGIDQRLQRDIIDMKPTVVTIMLGMNDAGYVPFDANIYKTYTTGYEKIVGTIKKQLPTARGWLIRPSPYDDVTRPFDFPLGYNSVLLKYGTFTAQLATRNAYSNVDFNKPVTDLLKSAFASDPELSKQIIQDRIHPGNAGHYVMTWALLKAWGATGLVSSSTVDAATAVATGDNVQFRNVKGGTSKAEWESLEGALPFPFDRNDPAVNLALKVTNLDKSMNLQTIKVPNLASGLYALKIDGNEVGRFTNGALKFGVNIGNLYTPMMDQAASVNSLTWQRSELQKNWWREVQFKYAWLPGEGKKDAVKGHQAMEADFVTHQRAAAQPTWHRFEIAKI